MLFRSMNDGFVRPTGGDWNGNLDAFNDYLKWPEESEYELEISGSDQCAGALGHDAMANELRRKLGSCHPSHAATIRADIAAAEKGQGRTLFDLVREIIAEDGGVHVVLA